MKPREIFVLAVRILGVWALISSIEGLLLGFVAIKATPGPLISALAQIAAGIYCLRGAPQLVEIAYPSNDPSKPNTP
jgi:hypothetical protein